MAASREAPRKTNLDLQETGTEPEYFITHIAKAETASAGCIRLYCAAERRGVLRLEYTVVVSAARLSQMARDALHIAADLHNLALWDVEFTDGH